MAALKALRPRRAGPGPAVVRAFWGGHRKEEKEAEKVIAEEKEAEKVIAEEEEKSQPSLLCPPPRNRSYVPPQDLQGRLESHVREVFGPSLPQDWEQTPLQENRLKFQLLAGLAVELGHAVPNSQLHLMRRAGDVLSFYRTPVKDATKFDELVAAELPPNLKIIWKQ